MVTEFGWLYVALVTLLFLPWAYGIVRFVMDLKNVFIPKGRQYLRGRRQLSERKREEQEAEERERELY